MSAPGWRSSTIDLPFGMIRRVQTSSTRDWPNAIWLSYRPIRRDPCGMSRIFAGRAVVDVLRDLGGDLAGQIGADAGDQRGRNDGAGLHDIGRRRDSRADRG